MVFNFDYAPKETTHYGLAYDFQSVMHYINSKVLSKKFNKKFILGLFNKFCSLFNNFIKRSFLLIHFY